MKNKFWQLFLAVALPIGIISCSGSGSNENVTDTASSEVPMPAPDNSNATNPSVGMDTISSGIPDSTRKDSTLPKN